jgi:hypothetical protein
MLLAKAMGSPPIAPEMAGTEWRAIVFIYEGGKYKQVMDMLDGGYKSVEECQGAMKEAAESLKIPANIFLYGACVHIPLPKPATST